MYFISEEKDFVFLVRVIRNYLINLDKQKLKNISNEKKAMMALKHVKAEFN